MSLWKEQQDVAAKLKDMVNADYDVMNNETQIQSTWQ
jgi:hypothetical protein